MLFSLFVAVLTMSALVFLTAWFFFRKAFCRPRCQDLTDENTLLHSQWFSYAAALRPALKWFQKQNWQECQVQAADGVALCGLWLPRQNSHTTLLLFHDYCGGPQDMALLAQWGYQQGYSIFAAYERAHGFSGGKYCSMGIRESQDCLIWAKKIREICGSSQKLVLCGNGLGAAAAYLSLYEGADREFSAILCDSPIADLRKLMKTVIRNQLHMQVFPMLQILCLYGRLLWGKSPDSTALQNLPANTHSVPVFFVGGQLSRLVPWEDIQRLANAYTGPKHIFTCEYAGHCAAILADTAGYLNQLKDFFAENGIA